MKRTLGALTGVASVVVLLGVAFWFSPLSKRTASLRLELTAEDTKGHRATLVNDGYLPVVVGRCDTVSDTMQPDTRVGDAIQRWDTERRTWVTVYHRSECKIG